MIRLPIILAVAAAALVGCTGAPATVAPAPSEAVSAPLTQRMDYAATSPETRNLTYVIETDGRTALVTYNVTQGGSVSTNQVQKAKNGWTTKVTGTNSGFVMATLDMVPGRLQQPEGTVRCRIIDTDTGRQLREQTAQGQFASASCTVYAWEM